MCLSSSPKSPPPPPPPPAAPPVLEQEAPKLSQADEDNSTLDRRSRGLKSYKIERRNRMMDRSNRIGGIGGGSGTGAN